MTKSRAAVQLKSGGECCWFQLVSVGRILVVELRYLVPAATSFTAAAFLSSVTTGWVSWKYILSRWTPVYLSRRALYATALVSFHLAGKRNGCAAAPVEKAALRRHPANMFLSSATSIWERLQLFLIAHFVSHLSHIWLHGCRAEIVRHPFVKKNSYQQLKTCFLLNMQCMCRCVPFCLGHPMCMLHIWPLKVNLSSHHPSVPRGVNLANRSCVTLSDLCSVQCFRRCTLILKRPIFKALSVSRYRQKAPGQQHMVSSSTSSGHVCMNRWIARESDSHLLIMLIWWKKNCFHGINWSS